ncbi:MAG TPA: winged helix-turn-helix domain-containing protein [Phycisphaerae bacterium]|nr:winged helix-turn-helix domain-containing protein [Phycisphaerae bacterium]
MKKNEVKVGTVYRVKVSGSVQDVRITGENPHGGWDGVNVTTNRKVRIKSPQRLRAVAGERPAKRKKIVSLAQHEAGSKGEQKAKDGAAATTEGKPADGGAKTPAKKRQPKSPRHSLVNAAILVLAGGKEPMNAKAIVEQATADGLYEPGDGKTPQATLYAAMLRDKKTRFHKADRGVWTLTDAGKAEVDAIRQAFAAK